MVNSIKNTVIVAARNAAIQANLPPDDVVRELKGLLVVYRAEIDAGTFDPNRVRPVYTTEYGESDPKIKARVVALNVLANTVEDAYNRVV